MFTAALRFVPDFIAESHAVQEAQACRGLSLEGKFIKRIKSYASVIQPLLLKSLGRSETMALSWNYVVLWSATPQLCCIRRIEKNRLYCDCALIAITVLLFLVV